MLGVRNQPGWWVTIAEKDLDGWNALALAKSLRMTLTTRELCILIGDRVSEEMKALLAEMYDYIMEIQTTGDMDSNISPEGLLTLSVWKCCTKRAIFVHPCSLVLKNCDELFSLNEEFAAIPNTNNPHQFDTAFFILQPNFKTFKCMMKELSNLKYNNNLASAQEALNSYFKNGWSTNSKAGLGNGTAKLGSEFHLVVGKEFDKNAFNSDTKIIRFATEAPWKLDYNDVLDSWMDFFRNTILDLPKHLLDDEQVQKYKELCFDDSHSNLAASIPEEIFSTSTSQTAPHSQAKSKQVEELGDAISIIGLSCRFPGANNEGEFWELLLEGRDETRILPPERFFTKPDLENDYGTPAGYLKCSIEDFDAKFFEISPREAEYMDPQQRLLLEVSWEALEHAGINPQRLHGTNTAVFVGLWAQEYAMHITNESRNGRDFQHKYLGNALCASAARISHCLGLRGPSVAMEAGCASALEGVHYACEALKSRETDLALACGVNVALGFSGELSALDSFLLSPDGKCKTFDESANGFARGEACVSLVLKRMSDAVRDGDKVLGVIRGSALNNDGAGSALGTPNAAAQEIVLKTALKVAGIGPNDVSYIEAHGTGTPIGDPIEFHALNQVFGRAGTGRLDPLYVGSVKTNIGHTEGSSGMAGMVKVLLSMRHRTIPRHLHLNTLNPYIKVDEIPAIIPQTNTEWKSTSKHGLIAGVSSFGLSGTNVHVIVQEPPRLQTLSLTASDMERSNHVITLSAKSETALQKLVDAYISMLESDSTAGSIQLPDLAYSANTGRAHFRHRLAILSKDTTQLLARLKKGYHISNKSGKDKPKIAFLFTGQGSQYVAMAKTLYSTHPVFKSTFHKCAHLLKSVHSLDLGQILSYDATATETSTANLDESIHSQPAIFCIEICLAELWASFGVVPDFVLGHSVGEFAAAVVAGVLSLEEGLSLVVGRSKLVNTLEHGAMMVVKSSQDIVKRLISEFEDESNWIDIAAINSTSEVVVSGSLGSITQFEAYIQKNSHGVGTQRLAASHAFHSRDMDLIMGQYEQIVRTINIEGRVQRCRYMSGTFAHEMHLEDFQTSYWLSHLREPVNFIGSFSNLVDEKVNVFVEVGAQPVLLGLGMGSVLPDTAQESCWCPSIRKTEDNWLTLLTSVAKMYTFGVDVDWTRFDAPFPRRRIPLPTYPWQHEKFWYKGKSSKLDSLIINSKQAHPLLGKRIPSPLTDCITYYNSISLESLPYIKDHKVADKIILPAAGYLEAILAAGRDVLCCGTNNAQIPLALENLVVESALPLKEEQCTQLQTVLNASTVDGQLQYEVRIYRQTVFDPSGSDSGKWKKLVSATFVPCAAVDQGNALGQNSSNGGGGVDIEALTASMSLRDTVDDIYEKIAEMGITFGPLFKSIQRIWYSDTDFLMETSLPEGSERYVCHPIILDAMIQSCVASIFSAGENKDRAKGLYLPMMVKKCVVLTGSVQTPKLYIHSLRAVEGEGFKTSVVKLFNQHGAQLAFIDGIDLVQTTVPSFLRLIASDADEYPGFFEEIWQPRLGVRGSRIPAKPEHPDVEGSTFKDKYMEVMDRVTKHSEFVGPVLPQFDAICYAYILRAMGHLGWNYGVGDEVSIGQFTKTAHVLSRHSQLLVRWFDILQDEGDIRIDPENPDLATVLRRLPTIDETESRIAELAAWFTKNYDEVEPKFIINCGEQLPEVLRGKTSVFSVLFPETSGVVGAAEMYRNSTFKFLHEVGARLIHAQLHVEVEDEERQTGAKLKDYTFRVLEVGAGTGSATESLRVELDTFGVPYEYTVTDVSPLLLNEAKKRFADKPNFRFKILDIEHDPKGQGFAPHYYDCILADNVMHATRSLSETLSNLRHLLVPAGIFVFTELVAPLRIVDISFGLLDAWWRFSDTEIRKKYPTVSTQTWFELLKANGFVNPKEYGKISGLDYRNIVAFASQDKYTLPVCANNVSTPGHDVKQGTWLIFGTEENEFSIHLAQKLRFVGKEVIQIEAALESESISQLAPGRHAVNPVKPSNFQDLFEEMKKDDCQIEGILYLWGICSTFPASVTDIDNGEHLREICGGLLHIMQALNVLDSKPKLVVVTNGAQYIGEQEPTNPLSATLSGMLMSFLNEFADRHAVAIDVDPEEVDIHASCQDVFYQLWLNEAENQVAFRARKKYVRRLVNSDPYKPPLIYPNAERYKLEKPANGTIPDMQIVAAVRKAVGEGEVEIKVAASALNFKDVLIAMSTSNELMSVEAGKATPKFAAELGVDFSGVVTSIGSSNPDASKFKVGDRVFGFMPGGALASHVVVSEKCVHAMPEGMSFEDGCTLPCVYLTALYFMVHIGKLTATDRVLIHVASGGVGLAAIQVARAIGAEIFATAGSKRKRKYLESLGIRHLYNSRNSNYGEQIMTDTNGAGITVVLNALTGPGFKEATLNALAEGGRFLEMSKLNVWTEEEVRELRPDVFYFLQKISEEKGTSEMMGAFGDGDEFLQVSNMLLDGLAAGAYRPIPHTLFPFSRVQDAFRYLQEAKHIGKVVVRMPVTGVQGGRIEHKEELFNAHSTYMITGGLGGLGLEVAKWMVGSGAKYMVLVGRNPPSPRAEHILSWLRTAGACVSVQSADVSDLEACQRVLSNIKDPATGFPPLKGIMHAAGVLADGLIINQDLDAFMAVYKPKVNGTCNLHFLTLDSNLEHFVLFSSLSSALGGIGQPNHCSANKYLDSFARFRTEQGLPCCSVNWGGWSDVGAAAGFKNLETTFGMRLFTPAQGIASLQRAMLSQKTNTVIFDVADGKVLATTYNAGAYFDLMKTNKEEITNSAELEARLQAVKEADPSEREGKIREFIEYVIRDTLRLPDTEPIDPDQDVREMGIDSLMAMELRSKIQHLLEGYDTHALSIHDLQENRTVNKLAKLINDTVNKGVASRKLTPEELMTLIKGDVILPEDIVSVNVDAVNDSSRSPVNASSELKSVLLTGATGHLAPYMLEKLLNSDPGLTVHCLIRAKSDEGAKDRLEATLDELNLLEEIDMSRVRSIAGNVTTTGFGLEPDVYDRLTHEVDSIIHCAALANFALPYGPFSGDDIRTNNVIGLLNVLRFATTGRVKPLQFESSIYALTKLEIDGSLPDHFPGDEDFGESLKTGYHISKFVCEKLLKQAMSRGIPLTALRHHYLIGDSRNGLIPLKRNNLVMFMLTCQKIGKFPEVDPNSQITAVPVDIAAKVSVQLFLDRSVECGVYNINNPKIRGVHDLAEMIQGRGFDFEIVPYSKWREAALASQGIEYAPLAELYIKDLFSSDMITQHTLTKNALAGHGMNMVSNSGRLKKYLPHIDEVMVDPIDMAQLQLDYYEKMFGKGNMKAFFEAVGK